MIDIKNYCIDGKCSRCGCCCTDFAYISDVEIARIKKFLKKHPIKELNGKPDFNSRVPIICPFYNAIERKCNIYSVRPRVCRLFQCNKSPEELESNKQKFIAKEYHNVADFMSWHKIFYNNSLQEDHIRGLVNE